MAPETAPTDGSDTSRSENAEGWRLIRRQFAKQWRGVGVGVLFGVLWTGGKVSVPALVRAAVDGTIALPAGQEPEINELAKWALLLGLAGVVAAVFTGLRRYIAFREARRAEADMRDRLYAHVQRLHFSYHDRTQTGQLMSRANTDLQQFQTIFVMIPITLSNMLTVVLVTIFMALIDPVMTVLALGSLPLLNILGLRFSQAIFPTVMRIQQESAELASVVEESVSGVRVIKGFGAEKQQLEKLSSEADDVSDASMAAARIRARYLPVIEILPKIGLTAVLAYGGLQVIDGSLTLGELTAFNVYVVMLTQPLRMLGMIVPMAQRASAAAQRVQEVLATAPEIVDHPKGKSLPQFDTTIDGRVGDVSFDEVMFAYEPGNQVLDGFSLTIPAGTSVALVGPTGSGKTTVARLIPRFYDIQSGAVLVDGVDVRELRLRELRRTVGIVFEDTFLFSDTVRTNIAFAHPHASQTRIERAARLAGAHEFIRRMPHGYETRIGGQGFTVSGGQRQRIAIARAILADPRVLILDDATSSVDPTKEHQIREALSEVMRDRTTIVIAHRPATIALADRVVLIENGAVFAEGTHDQLLATSERYREVLAEADRSGVASEHAV
jgi:ATP-binding cassette subfamily B protein